MQKFVNKYACFCLLCGNQISQQQWYEGFKDVTQPRPVDILHYPDTRWAEIRYYDSETKTWRSKLRLDTYEKYRNPLGLR